MNYLSVCSGIEAATVAWHGLQGWAPVAFCEVDPFCQRVLAYRFPAIPNLGDIYGIRNVPGLVGAIQSAGVGNGQGLLVGGTPCQGFSVAGLGGGFSDPRGAITLEYLEIIRELRPRWIVWENVPGVLGKHRAEFAYVLSKMVECGYGVSYRILDAQYFGVAQVRRRVFVVACAGEWAGWAGAGAVLQECAGVQGGVAKGRKKREVGAVAGTLSSRTEGGGGLGTDFELGGGLVPELAETLRSGPAPGGRGHGKVNETDSVTLIPELAPTLMAKGNHRGDLESEVFIPEGGNHQTWRVRQLTPIECARLQGFPDGWTNIPDAKGKYPADGPQYKAYGNSMAVPVMAWIGRRLDAVDKLTQAGRDMEREGTGKRFWWDGCGV